VDGRKRPRPSEFEGGFRAPNSHRSPAPSPQRSGPTTAGTNTTGARVDSATVNATLAASDVVQLNQGADVTGKGAVVYEYEALPDAVQTA